MEYIDEEWKKITEFPNYEVSTYGRIKNILTTRILKINKKNGYLCISLVNKINRKIFKIHRLVALEFIPNPENKPEVNHKDKNKLNNHLINLEWNTRLENNQHRCIGLISDSNRKKKVHRIDKITNNILEKYDSIELAGEWAVKNNLTKNAHNGRNSIGNSVVGLSKTAYGYKWKIEKEIEELDGEVWKEIPLEDSKGYYVSDLGRFKNKMGVIMTNYKTTNAEYIRINIKNKTYLLHRLIALTFLSNLNNKEQVNHIDGNKLNNTTNNLEWCTNKENQIHKYQTGLGNNFTRKIIQYDSKMNLIGEHDSITGASKILNIGKSNIIGVLRNKRKTAGGFIFKYLE